MLSYDDMISYFKSVDDNINYHYMKRYYNLICIESDLKSYTESHHILPKSMFPESANLVICDWNKVDLNSRLHYLSHYLLHKALPSNVKMLQAFMCMCNIKENLVGLNRKNKINSKLYESAKQKYIHHMSSLTGLSNYNADLNVYTFKNIKTNEIIIDTRSNFKERSGIDDQEIYNLIANISKTSKNWGIWLDELQMFSFEIPHKTNKNTYKKIPCEHCNKNISLANYKKWHGDRCKMVDPIGHNKRSQQVTSINKKSS